MNNIKDRIEIAKKFYFVAKKSVLHGKIYKKLSLKCFNSYVYNCILKGENEFKLIFKGKYIHDTKTRIENWVRYFCDVIYTRFLILFKIDIKNYKQYELFYYGPYKPLHVKVTNAPNESILEQVLKDNGFKIKDEYLGSVDTIYYVAKI